jgi:RNA polymerase sigma-70 factor (sigma-E family)
VAVPLLHQPSRARPVTDAGDALAELYRSEYRNLLGLAAVLCDDSEACHEIVQSAFVAAFVHWNRIREPERAPAYVRSSVMNGARSRLRRRQVADRHPDSPAAPVDGPEAAAVARRQVVSALRSLPPRQRESLALRYLLDLPDADVAEAMGVSLGSVKTHIHRCLTSLRRQLGTEDG